MSDYLHHPTAIISLKAKLGTNVKIGPFSIIEDDVEIGDNTEIRSHVVIANGSRIGNDNKIYKGTVIGTEPQDLKFNGAPTSVIIGDRNLIREFVTINRGSNATGKTVVGNDNMLMTYGHIAHDCVLGNNIVLANVVQLGGHVHVEDWVTLGGVCKVHQFCMIGCHSMIGGDVKVTKDIPPYTLIDRVPPKVENINIIGLKRRGFTDEVIKEIQNFYNIILHSGFNNSDGIKYYEENHNIIIPEVQHCIDFIHESKRGIYR